MRHEFEDRRTGASRRRGDSQPDFISRPGLTPGGGALNSPTGGVSYGGGESNYGVTQHSASFQSGQPGQGGGDARPPAAGNGAYPTQQNRRDTRPWQSDRRREFDSDYQQWRTEQMNQFDNDYNAWKEARYEKFLEEFNQWRNSRSNTGSNPGSDPGSSSATGGTVSVGSSPSADPGSSGASGLPSSNVSGADGAGTTEGE